MARKRDRILHPFSASSKSASRERSKEETPPAKEKGRLAQFFSFGARAAGTVSSFSDALPPLKLTADVLKIILENASTMEENKADAEALCSRIHRLQEMIGNSIEDPTSTHTTFLKSALDNIIDGLQPIWGRSDEPQKFLERCGRFVFAPEHKSRIKDFVASIDRALLDYKSAVISDLHADMLRRIDKDQQDALNTMKPVSESMHDASDKRTPCLPGTRVEILDKLDGWAKGTTATQVYWLNGHAGSGKSTIAQSLAERLFAQERLGASFFCSRNSQRTSDLKTIFPKDAPGNHEESTEYRRHHVLSLRTTETTYSRACNAVSAILDLLSQHAARLPRLKIKFFITSRPESHIRSGFRLRPLKELTDVMVIHEVAADSIDQDIRLFLDHNFLRIVTSRSDINLSESVWPKPEEINTLVIASAGLFIFASTIIKFLDNARGDPKTRLRQVFDFENKRTHKPQTSSARYPFDDLDKLYSTILKEAQPDYPEELREILGLIVLAYTPVSIATIAEILGFSDDNVRTHLRPLHSVLLVPEKATNTLRLHHKSFADFLVDPARCMATEFVIMEDDHHRSIALHCLELMKGGLKKNICELPRYSMNSVLAPGTLDKCVCSALRYCCQYWAKHLTSDHLRGEHFSGAQPQLEYLLTKQMLMWVEVLSLIGDLPSTVHSLVMLQEWLTKLEANDAARMLLECVKDGHRLILLAFDVISMSVSHIYHSALVFAPEQSLLKRAHATELTVEARLLIGGTIGWKGPLRTIEIKYIPRALEFSHDGSMLALGGAQEDSCVVHPSTGTRMCSFKAEFEKRGLPSTSWVTSISFSADNQLLAMSFDKSPFLVLLYDVHAGLTSAQHLNTDYNKLMVAFCPSSHYAPLLLISPQERTRSNLQLYLWDTSSGTPGDSEGRPNCDRLSLDRVSAWCWLHGDQATPQIAVGLSDGSMEIRSVAPAQSPALLAHSDSALFASPIVSMASSQDGARIAALSADGELSLFTTQTHQSGARQLTHMLSFPKELRLPSTDERSTPPKLYFMQESHTLAIKERWRLRAFRVDCSGSQAGVEEIGLSILNSELYESDTVAFSPDGQHIAYDRNIASLSAAIPSLLQHHRDSLRTVGAPEPESHYSVCYCDGQVVITGNYIWDITKHERRYSCGNEIGEMSSAFPVKNDIILSCNQRGDVTLLDLSRERPVIKRWAGRLGGSPELHLYSCTASTIRFLSYSYTVPVGITLQLWAITNLDTLSLPQRYTAGDSGPRLHQIAAGQIQMESEPSIDAIYHEYLANSNREEAVFYLEVRNDTPYMRERYRGFHMWSTAQAGDSEHLVIKDGSGPEHIKFVEVPTVWSDKATVYPIAGDGLFRMSEDRRWVLDSRRRKRLWLPPAYTSQRPGGIYYPEELRCARGSTFAIEQPEDCILKTLIDFSCTNLDDSVPF